MRKEATIDAALKKGAKRSKKRDRGVVAMKNNALPVFVETGKDENAMPPLREIFKDYFPIGVCVNPLTLRTHRKLILEHFSSLTAEDEMKFDRLQPEEGRFNFAEADAIVAFARENGFRVRGHTLVWHNQTPEWVFLDKEGQPAPKELVLERMEEHITTVVSRYKGEIKVWDVVNEAVSDRDGFLRVKSPWYQRTGEEFIARAFTWAHRVHPEAKLFYNDYNAAVPEKRDRIVKFLKNLLEQGVPVHGMGIQGHWTIYDPSLDEIEAAIEAYAALGLEVEITELDVSLYHWSDTGNFRVPPPELLEKQAERYREIFDLFRRYRGIITGVTVWGPADDRTWKDNFPVQGRKDWPLLFDENHRLKPVLF
jgi:endo-1,4-beta-xylanase